MVTNGRNRLQPSVVLFSAGLDSAVLLALALTDAPATPVYVASGLAWEREERQAAERLLAAPFAAAASPLVVLTADMSDVYPADHWARRGVPPAFDTPDEDVYLDGRNIVLLSKTAVFAARAGIGRILLGPLAGNPFPDATPEFFSSMGAALARGLAAPLAIETPLSALHKPEVVALGNRLQVPFDLTLSCMQPAGMQHCGRCSKCRERRDGFLEAGIPDPTAYRERPSR